MPATGWQILRRFNLSNWQKFSDMKQLCNPGSRIALHTNGFPKLSPHLFSLYLKSYLVGSAAKICQNINICETNYQVAYDLIFNKFYKVHQINHPLHPNKDFGTPDVDFLLSQIVRQQLNFLRTHFATLQTPKHIVPLFEDGLNVG